MSELTADRAVVCEVILTGPDQEWAAAITRRLVQDRLVACGHISGAIRSIYRWAGSVHDEPEVRVMVHTRTALVDAVAATVQAEHPYEVACVAAVPIVGGSSAYVDWVLAETDPPEPGIGS